jgi:hypothetical protein
MEPTQTSKKAQKLADQAAAEKRVQLIKQGKVAPPLSTIPVMVVVVFLLDYFAFGRSFWYSVGAGLFIALGFYGFEYALYKYRQRKFKEK